ncbi:hypothetical protein HUU62_02675 [Rhodoferax sp. 4810]|nr:hypothetical protein [Rhodoferax jenense]
MKTIVGRWLAASGYLLRCSIQRVKRTGFCCFGTRMPKPSDDEQGAMRRSGTNQYTGYRQELTDIVARRAAKLTKSMLIADLAAPVD